MSNKLGPELQEMAERGVVSGESSAPLEVLVGLTRPIDAEIRRELEGRGLTVRSEVGDVLTGVVRSADLPLLADAPVVVKIDASRPMRPETEDGSTPK